MSRGSKGHATSRADKFSGTLHDAESRQLESFVKSRNSELDKEIAAMKSRLGSSAMNMCISGRGLTAMDGVRGRGGNPSAANMNKLREVEQEELSHHRRNHAAGGVSGHRASNDSTGMSDDEYSPSPIPVRPGNNSGSAGEIKSLLSRIKMKMEDNDMSPAGESYHAPPPCARPSLLSASTYYCFFPHD